MWEDTREGMDAGLTRYPPYPNGATARWPCLAEGPRCGRGRGAGWSSCPLLRFQPWQPDWAVRARGPTKTPIWEGLRCSHQGPDAPSSVKGIRDQLQDVGAGSRRTGICGRPHPTRPAPGLSLGEYTEAVPPRENNSPRCLGLGCGRRRLRLDHLRPRPQGPGPAPFRHC